MVLTDLRSCLPLGPVIRALLLLREGRVLLGEGLEEAPSGAGFFSVRFFCDATLLFSLKLNDLLSCALPLPKLLYCPLLIRSRPYLRADCVPGSLNQLKNSSSTFNLRTGWRTCGDGILVTSYFSDGRTCVGGKVASIYKEKHP